MFGRGTVLSKLSALSLLAFVAAGLYLFVVEPVMAEYDKYRAAIDQSSQLIGRYEARRLDVDALRAELKNSRTDGATSGTFLKTESASLAAADLQGRIARLVKSVNGQLTSTQPMPDSSRESFQKVVVRANMKITTQGMVRIVHRLESGRPYLLVDNVVIRRNVRPNVRVRRGVRKNRRGVRKKRPGADLLDVRFDVYGYLWKREGT